MESVEEAIPAFSTWKMLNETIITLQNVEYSERNFEKLENIFKSREFYDIFVPQDNSLSFKDYDEVAKKYTACTVWLLGRFFYLCSCEKLSRLHNLIADVQLQILHNVLIKQPHIFHQLSTEYISALKQLNEYHEKGEDRSVLLRAFIPQTQRNLQLDLSPKFVEVASLNMCFVIQMKVLKIIEAVLYENISLYFIKEQVYDILNCLLYILKCADISLVLAVFRIYVTIVKKHELSNDRFPFKMIEKCNAFSAYLEQYVYHVYNREFAITEEEMQAFDHILAVFFSNYENVGKQNMGILTRTSNFIIFKLVLRNSLKNFSTSEELQRGCVKVIAEKSDISMNIDNFIKAVFERHMIVLLDIIERQVVAEIKVNWDNSVLVEAYNGAVSETWLKIHGKLMVSLEDFECKDKCKLQRICELLLSILEMILRIRIALRSHCAGAQVVFFQETGILRSTFSCISGHFTACKTTLPFDVTAKVFVNLPVGYIAKNIMTIFYIVGFPFLLQSHKNTGAIISKVSENFSEAKATEVAAFILALSKQSHSTKSSFIELSVLVRYLVSGVVIDREKKSYNAVMDAQRKKEYGLLSFESCTHLIQSGAPDLQALVAENFPYFLSYFDYTGAQIAEILRSLCSNKATLVNQCFTEALRSIIHVLLHQYYPVVCWNRKSRTLKIDICTETELVTYYSNVNKKQADQNETVSAERLQNYLCEMYGKDCSFALFNKGTDFNPQNKPQVNSFFTHFLDHDVFACEDAIAKINVIKTLPSFARLVTLFHTNDNTKLWLRFASDEDVFVRKAFAEAVSQILYFIQTKEDVPRDYFEKVTKICFTSLEKATKKSLQHTDVELQDTLLQTIQNMSEIQDDNIALYTMHLLLYFIMIPTSRHALNAVYAFIELSKRHNSNTYLIYAKFKRELCKRIVELCAINHDLMDYSLAVSLEKVSQMLGLSRPKDFVAAECRYLLPCFIPAVIQMPVVAMLLKEVADMVDSDLPELLASRYAYIFLHISLNESEEVFKKCMNYIDGVIKKSSAVLRKGNMQVILNELLLNFHNKRHRVLKGLILLASETEGKRLAEEHIPDYLQPRFLGILASFDIKLKTAKKQVLRSLTEILKFMGPKHITPLRFKIIAMLKTASDPKNGDYPELYCQVWYAFIRSSDMDALGPQLATIFISILPFNTDFPNLVNTIFRYLVIANEVYVRDYVQDLFFALESDISDEIRLVIKKHVQRLENNPFKVLLKSFLKYLSHENVDIRVYALKYLKNLMEKNREELDRMILGYNGIDPTIVELLDILTLGCREKEKALKLGCGECIGELGAVEPSHLPQRYTHEEQSFTFFITEDRFIVNALNELTRALQAEKNTQNMDRFALAIQEILRAYEISPEGMKSTLWKEFPEAQRELMLPLLTSRYTMVQPPETITICPIYGSNIGATFQLWVYNWVCSLIALVKADKRTLLQVCLPSLKNDHRILMHFLPHILLHALVEGTDDGLQRIYEEVTAVISSFDVKCQLDPNILHVRPLRLESLSAKPQPITDESEKRVECIKIVFILLDFLDCWIREFEWQRGTLVSEDANYGKIQVFLTRFCKLQLARCNYQCGEYPRALMCLEQYIGEQTEQLSNHFAFLAELYAQVDEPDGVAGVMALQQSEPSLEERILALEVSGKLADAVACYERMVPPLKLHHLQGLVQCYLDLDNVNTALNLAEGALCKQPEYSYALLEIQAEPLWRLGRYDDLDTLLKKTELQDNNSWGALVGQALLQFKNGNRDVFKKVLKALRNEQVESLGAGSLEEGAYRHGYSHIVRLHALTELEQVEKMVYELLVRPNDHNACESVLKRLATEWELRIKVVQESVKIVEPVLCLRRIAVEQAKQIVSSKVPSSVPLLDSLLGECWLLSTKTARAAGMHQQAYTYSLKAEEYAPPRLFLEKAKLHWLREEQEDALTTLRRGLEKLIPNSSATSDSSNLPLTLEQRKMCAEAKLLIATYNDSTSNVDTDVNIHHYREAVEMYREWEKSLVCLAQYYDRIFQTFSNEDRDAKGSDMQIHMINYFGKSLLYGTNYVYQSMPRLLSIWFDYGTRLLDVSSSVKDDRKCTLLKMTKLIDTFLEKLPAFIFLTAFSQLVSRICHPQKEVYIELKSIIIKLILQYPQQSMWMIISVIKSSYSVRSKRCAEILHDGRLKTPSMMKLVTDFTKLAEKLIELCNKDIPEGVHTTNVNTLLRTLPRLLSKSGFSEIMMPTQKFRKMVLPNPDFANTQHNPFPNRHIHIIGIEDEVVILPSLQRPRKIVLRGSDGKGYIQMLKPKDDLRKDFRLMEFNDIVNQLLSREAESRQRRLNIRIYSVVPLNEECGLIEWVPNLVGLRPILMTLYKQRGMAMKGRELKQLCCNQKDTLAKKRDVYLKELLRRHPPVLGEWFRRTFPDAQGWLSARTAYIRTTAVISMVGYMLGLGDRHGENILLDSTCGDTVHVDFNCLFNKGESFEWPERVPFRLTHNMVAAMGPLGVEGVFRRSCECTLRVLRTYTNTLMSIVTPFVYDPLVSWPRNIAATTSAVSAERTNEQALEHIRNIELRLQGMVRSRGRSFSIPLSAEGQTNNLILEAMSVDNLCQMYVGWGPYL